MRYPTKTEFKLLALSGLVLCLAGACLDEFRIPTPTPEESDALDWNSWGAIAPDQIQMVFWCILGTSSLIGFVGFNLFLSWSRWVLLLSMAATCLFTPFMGLTVSRALGDAVGSIGGMLFMFPFVLSFFEPCCTYFRQVVQAKPDESSKTLDR